MRFFRKAVRPCGDLGDEGAIMRYRHREVVNIVADPADDPPRRATQRHGAPEARCRLPLFGWQHFRPLNRSNNAPSR